MPVPRVAERCRFRVLRDDAGSGLHRHIDGQLQRRIVVRLEGRIFELQHAPPWVVQQLAASKIPVVVAVSCNVATFARDARILIDGGYRIEGVTPVDQFRHTPHVELVARFSK